MKKDESFKSIKKLKIKRPAESIMDEELEPESTSTESGILTESWIESPKEKRIPKDVLNKLKDKYPDVLPPSELEEKSEETEEEEEDDEEKMLNNKKKKNIEKYYKQQYKTGLSAKNDDDILFGIEE